MWPVVIGSLDNRSSDDLRAAYRLEKTTSMYWVHSQNLTRIINPEAEARPEQTLASR
jgi:hypothetical protein